MALPRDGWGIPLIRFYRHGAVAMSILNSQICFAGAPVDNLLKLFGSILLQLMKLYEWLSLYLKITCTCMCYGGGNQFCD